MDGLTLATLGEEQLVSRLTDMLPQHSGLLTGPGDDCAVVRRTDDWDELLKTDVVVEKIHFLPEEQPERIGWKALARAVSDIAAMGGIPEYALVTLLADKDQPFKKIQDIYQGLVTCAETYGVGLAGGETSSLPEQGLILNIALTGRVERGTAVLRSGARPGDHICVTGCLGGTLAGHHLDFLPRCREARFLHDGAFASSMMDLSDGLGKDLPRLCRASGVSCRIREQALPMRENCTSLQALTDGEDYELLFTVSPDRISLLQQQWPVDFPQLSIIGEITTRENAKDAPSYPDGWDHFSPSSPKDFSR